MVSLTLISTRSVGILQSTRPLSQLGSIFNWQSEDQCQRTNNPFEMGFCSYKAFKKQIQPINVLKTVSKVGDLSSIMGVTAHGVGVLWQVRTIVHCIIGTWPALN